MLGNLNTPYKTRSESMQPTTDLRMQNRDFKVWTGDNMYRTSYRDMSKKWPQKPKKEAKPGYQGYIPGEVPDNNFAKTFTRISREQFNRQVYLPPRVTEFFPSRPFTTSLVGRTLGRFGGGLDDEYHTVSRFHGGPTIPKEHPNITHQWETTNRVTYTSQEAVRPQIFRSTDPQAWKSIKPSQRPLTQASGFVQNSTLFDGHGWLPVKEMHGDNTKTEYRSRYNRDVPFHPLPLKSNTRKMEPVKLVY